MLAINKLFKTQLKAEDIYLFTDMLLLKNMGSISSGNANLKALVNHFRGNTGAVFSSPYMDEQLKNHPTLKNFIYDDDGVLSKLQGELEINSGDLNKISFLKGEIEAIRPKFNTSKDKFNGMTLAVDDTIAYEVYIENYKLTSANSFSCDLKVIVYDHYGLDAADVKKYGTFAGFRAWYVLQHVRGYKPFLTKMTATVPIHNQKF